MSCSSQQAGTKQGKCVTTQACCCCCCPLSTSDVGCSCSTRQCRRPVPPVVPRRSLHSQCACGHVSLTSACHAAIMQVCKMENEGLKVRTLEEQAVVDGFREPSAYIPLWQANMPGAMHVNPEAQKDTGEGGEEREVRSLPPAHLQSAVAIDLQVQQTATDAYSFGRESQHG